MNPDTLLAPSSVEKPAPIARKSAVIHMVVAKIRIQNVKKEPASIFSPTMKYNTREKWEIWINRTGISAAICAMQKAAGWYRAKPLCFVRTGRPEKESVTSDMARRLLKRREKNSAPDLTKRPAEF